VKLRPSGLVPTTLHDRVARMHLDMTGEWLLPALAGISTSLLLTANGIVRVADGYDQANRLCYSRIPQLSLLEFPTRVAR
jgi:hypothetical protein